MCCSAIQSWKAECKLLFLEAMGVAIAINFQLTMAGRPVSLALLTRFLVSRQYFASRRIANGHAESRLVQFERMPDSDLVETRRPRFRSFTGVSPDRWRPRHQP